MARGFFLSLLFLLSACANPKYATPEPLSGTEQGTKLTCQARFQGGQCVAIQWEKLPTEEEFGAFIFRVFRDGEHATLVDLPHPHVVLWMPSMGHGSSPVAVSRLDTGSYRAEKVFFTMGGDWEIRFQSKEGADVRDQASIPFRF